MGSYLTRVGFRRLCRIVTSSSLPLKARPLPPHPSLPIHAKFPVALFLLTAFISSPTSWSEAKMITPAKTNISQDDDTDDDDADDYNNSNNNNRSYFR